METGTSKKKENSSNGYGKDAKARPLVREYLIYGKKLRPLLYKARPAPLTPSTQAPTTAPIPEPVGWFWLLGQLISFDLFVLLRQNLLASVVFDMFWVRRRQTSSLLSRNQ